MKAIVRKDEEAVSPVIATILMVAITVVLAAVLYVMVSGLIGTGTNAPNSIGITRTSSGGNWILTVSSVTGTMTNSTVFVTLQKSDGTSTNITAKALTTLTMATNGVVYQAAGGSGNIAAADTILISQIWWPAANGFRITLTYSGSIVYGPATLS